MQPGRFPSLHQGKERGFPKLPVQSGLHPFHTSHVGVCQQSHHFSLWNYMLVRKALGGYNGRKYRLQAQKVRSLVGGTDQ